MAIYIYSTILIYSDAAVLYIGSTHVYIIIHITSNAYLQISCMGFLERGYMRVVIDVWGG